jgi:hypothetical protein
MMALIYIFKSQGHAILNCPGFYEAILILMEQWDDDFLQSVTKHFCDDFDNTIY